MVVFVGLRHVGDPDYAVAAKQFSSASVPRCLSSIHILRITIHIFSNYKIKSIHKLGLRRFAFDCCLVFLRGVDFKGRINLGSFYY